MMKEDLNMDKAFRDKLNGLSQAPPPHVWDGIQGSLLAQMRKKRIVFFTRIAAAAVVVLAFLAGWFFNEKSDEIVPATVQTEIKNTESKNINPENEEVKITITENTLSEEIESTKTESTDLKTTHKTEKELIAVFETRTAEENEFEKRIERISVKMLNKLEVFLDLPKLEKLQLEEKEKFVAELNETEKILIAENIRNANRLENDEAKWKMGVHVAPGYSSQSSNYSETYSNNMTYSGENGNGNIGGGFSVQFKTSKKLSIESGVYYAQNGQQSSNSLNLFSAQSDYALSYDTEKSYFNTTANRVNGQIAMNSNAGIIEFSGTPEGTEMTAKLDETTASSDVIIASGEFAQVFDLIEIPLYLRYSLIDSKVGVEIMGGINAGIVTGNNVYMENQYGNQNVGKTKDISPVNLSGTIGVGINYAFGKHFSMAVEPRINYYLNSINQNPEVDYRPYRVGVYTGLYYEF